MTHPFPRLALPVSLALHVAFGVWVEVRAGERDPVLPTQPDRFSGEGIDVATVVTPVAAPPVIEPPARSGADVAEPAKTAAATGAPAVPRSRPRPRPATRDISPSSGSDRQTGGAGAPSSSTPAFGAAGLPPGVRHLPKAFARAIALANRADPRWRELAPGVVDETSIVLTVGGDGALGRLAFAVEADEARIAPVVRKLLDNTVLLLASGRFSLDASAVSPGTMRLRVRVEIEQRESAGTAIDPGELQALDHEPPRPGKRGHGAFVLNSGRRVVAWISLE